MSLNSFSVVIDQEKLKKLSDNNYCLGLSNTVNGQNNVVTVALPPKGDNAYSVNNTFRWTVKYSMAASQKPWTEGGVTIEVGSATTGVELKEGYKLESWSERPVIFPHNIDDALRFQVVQNDAAPVVYLGDFGTFNGRATQTFSKPSPIYIAPDLVLKPGATTLTPKQTAMVYFKPNIETGGMISETDLYLPRVIDLTTNPTGQVLKLDKEGCWTLID